MGDGEKKGSGIGISGTELILIHLNPSLEISNLQPVDFQDSRVTLLRRQLVDENSTDKSLTEFSKPITMLEESDAPRLRLCKPATADLPQTELSPARKDPPVFSKPDLA
jgi:hypothetical protein